MNKKEKTNLLEKEIIRLLETEEDETKIANKIIDFVNNMSIDKVTQSTKQFKKGDIVIIEQEWDPTTKSPLVNTDRDGLKAKFIDYNGSNTNYPYIVVIDNIDIQVHKIKPYVQESKEKDYEILSFKRKGSIHIWKKDSQLKDTFCLIDGKAPFTSLEEINKFPKIYEIYSLKRLSDGEIFTIGDNIQYNQNITKCNDKGKIKNFKITNNNVLLVYYGNKYSNLITVIQHCEKPLFITEDGVDIYENDTFYYLNISKFGIGSLSAKPGLGNSLNLKYFSTKEAADEYILMNKPCLSINDILNSQDGLMFAEKKLKQLVKSKI